MPDTTKIEQAVRNAADEESFIRIY